MSAKTLRRITNISPFKRLKLISAFAMFVSLLPTMIFAAELQKNTITAEELLDVHYYNIAPGSLSTVLSRFAGDSGVAMSFDASRFAGKNSPGLKGRYSISEGFKIILAGTGLVAVNHGNHNYVLQENNNVIMLDSVKVQSSVIDGQTTNGILATYSNSANKTNTALIDIPRSVTVIPRKQLDDQGVTTLSEALRYTPGVFSEVKGVDNRENDISARGFSGVSTFIDGMNMRSEFFPSVEMYGLEEVEVLRGPSSTLYGSGSLAGVVSSATKRPTIEPFKELQLLAGNFHHKEVRGDISDTVFDNNDIKYRLTALLRESKTQFDEVDDDKRFFAPSISWKPNNQLDITLMGYYQKNSGGNLNLTMPLTGSLLPNPNGKISNKTFFGEPDSDRFEKTTKSGAWDINYRFNDQWRLQNQARYISSTDKTRFHFTGGLLADNIKNEPLWAILFPGAVNALDQPLPAVINTPPIGPFPAIVNGVNPLAGAIPLNTMIRDPYWYDNLRDSTTVDTRLYGDVEIANFKHKLLVGLDYFYEDEDYSSFSRPNTFAPNSLLDALAIISFIDVYNPVYGNADSFYNTLTRKGDTKTKQVGVYIQDQMSINDKIMLTAGIRYDDYDQKSKVIVFDSVTEDYHLKEEALTYQAGANYKFDFGLVPYVSYAESFNPQSGMDYRKRPFDPLEGKQYEVGMKYQMYDGKLISTLAWFDLTQQNVKTNDPNHVGCGGTTFGACQITLGEVVSKGIELEIKANPISGLNVIANFSEYDVHTTKDDDASKVGKSPTEQPEKLASLWADYRFQEGVLQGFGMSAGGRYIGSTFADDANTLEVPSYTVFDVGMYYKTRLGIELAVNATNVTNKEYLASCTTTICRQGLARKVTAGLKYRW